MRKHLLTLTAILALIAGVGCSKDKKNKNSTDGNRCGSGYVYVTDYRILQIVNGGNISGGGNTYCQTNPTHPSCYGTNTGYQTGASCVHQTQYQYALQQLGINGGNVGNTGSPYYQYCQYWTQYGYDFNQCIQYCTSTNGQYCY